MNRLDRHPSVFAALTSLLLVFGATGNALAQQVHQLDLTLEPKPVQRGHLDLGGAGPDGSTIAVNSYYIEKEGRPFVPIVGEFHFSRYPADQWEEALRKMKAGGINVVASYVFWNLHEREEGRFDWSGNLDLRRFVETIHQVGLTMILRVGPFAHGEIRNGGLPDWIYGRPLEVRSNDPLYLDYTDKLYAAIAGQVKGQFFKDGGPIIGVQLENEFQHSAAPWDIRYTGAPKEFTVAERDMAVTHGGVSVSEVDNTNAGYGRDHMANLKLIAKRHGLDAPLYTATGWGNAAIVPRGSIPVTAAYPFPFWTPEATASPFYLFKDLHRFPDYMPVSYETELYPSLPAELGAGISPIYARRPFVPDESVAPMIVRVLGSGSNGIGYYMYHGGATPVLDDKFYNEDASGLPKINYDYQSPIGQYGRVKSHYFDLRVLHLFLASYGELLAPMASILPPNNARLVATDTATLRYAARAARGSGFVFLLNYQDHVETRDQADLQLRLNDGRRTIAIPSTGTFTLKSGATAVLPVNLALDGVTLRAATVQPLTILRSAATNRFVFFSIDGFAPELIFDGGAVSAAENCDVSSSDGATIVRGPADRCFSFSIDRTPVLVVPRNLARQAAPIADGRLWFSSGTVTTEGRSTTLLSAGETSVEVGIYPALDPAPRVEGASIETAVPHSRTMSAFRVRFAPVTYTAGWRQVAARRYAARFGADLNGLNDVFMRVDYVGDTGMAFIDSRMVDDHFYHGRPWEIGLKRFFPQLQENEMVFVFHAMPRDATYLKDIPAEVRPNFEAGERRHLKVGGIEFIPEYKAVITLPEPAMR